MEWDGQRALGTEEIANPLFALNQIKSDGATTDTWGNPSSGMEREAGSLWGRKQGQVHLQLLLVMAQSRRLSHGCQPGALPHPGDQLVWSAQDFPVLTPEVLCPESCSSAGHAGRVEHPLPTSHHSAAPCVRASGRSCHPGRGGWRGLWALLARRTSQSLCMGHLLPLHDPLNFSGFWKAKAQKMDCF